MVDLRSADPSLGVRGAASRVAAKLDGTPTTHAERLRKKYYELEKSGKLPKPTTWDAQIRLAYSRRRAMIEEAREKLSAVEREVDALGLSIRSDATSEQLSAFIQLLEREEERLEILTLGPPAWAVSTFVEQGITDAEEGVARFTQLVAERKRIEEALELLRRMRELRYVAELRLE